MFTSYLVLRILNSIFADKFELDQLNEFVSIWNAVEYRTQVRERFLMVDK